MANCYDVASCIDSGRSKTLVIRYNLYLADGTPIRFQRSRVKQLKEPETRMLYNEDMVPWRVTPTVLLRDFDCTAITAPARNLIVITGRIRERKLK